MNNTVDPIFVSVLQRRLKAITAEMGLTNIDTIGGQQLSLGAEIRRGYANLAASAIARVEASSDTSTFIPRALPPAATISSATALAPSSLRSATTTEAPSH